MENFVWRASPLTQTYEMYIFLLSPKIRKMVEMEACTQRG